MRKPRNDPVREDRIHEEAIVDAGPEEQAYGLVLLYGEQDQLSFQSQMRGLEITSPLAKGDVVEVLRMAPEDACMNDMLVLVRWQGRKLAVPLSQLTAVAPDEATEEAIGDWQHWVAYGYQL
jgi:hypothetical protein